MMFNKTLFLMLSLTLASLGCGVGVEGEGDDAAYQTSQAELINNGGGLSFSCNEPGWPGTCSCTGPIDSADCKAMKKNCSGDITCGWLVDNCTCKMALVRPTRPLYKLNTGGVIQGFSTF